MRAAAAAACRLGTSGAEALAPGFVAIMRLSAVASSVSYESPSCGKIAAPMLIASGSSLSGRASNSSTSTARCSSSTLALRLFAAAARQDDDELVAGVADADVVRPDAGAQDAGDFAQRAVADVVAVGVVDRP